MTSPTTSADAVTKREGLPELPATDGWMNLHSDQSVQQVYGVTMRKLAEYGESCYDAGFRAACAQHAEAGAVASTVPGVLREMREWLIYAEREDGAQTIAHADVAVRDWERRLGAAMLADAGLLHPAQPASQQGEDRLALELLVAAGFITPEKMQEALNIANGFAPGPIAHPTGDKVRGLVEKAKALSDVLPVAESFRHYAHRRELHDLREAIAALDQEKNDGR